MARLNRDQINYLRERIIHLTYTKKDALTREHPRFNETPPSYESIVQTLSVEELREVALGKRHLRDFPPQKAWEQRKEAHMEPLRAKVDALEDLAERIHDEVMLGSDGLAALRKFEEGIEEIK